MIQNIRLRLYGIDAPELNHPWGVNAKRELINLCAGQIVNALLTEQVSHERVIARCFLPDGRDLSGEMVRRGLAIDWAKHSGGKYRHLEPAGIRRKHWRADARQRGRMPMD